MNQKGLRLCFVAAATVINNEAVTFRSFRNFLARQLFVVRSCHSRWPVVLGHTLAINASMLGFVVLLFPIPFRSELAFALLGMTLLLYVQILGTDLAIRRLVGRRGEQLPVWPVPATMLRIPLAGTLLIALNLMAVVRVLAGGDHTWRGITYRFSYRGRTQPFCRVVAVEPLCPQPSVAAGCGKPY